MRMVALLRGINVGGNRKVPMPELLKVAHRSGFTAVETYINSGNLVFEAGKAKPEEVALLLEKNIEKHFGFPVDVIVRTATQWKKYTARSPFPNAARDRPQALMLGLSRQPAARDTAARLLERANASEQVKVVGDAIWVDFAAGAGKSKLTPLWFEKAAGSPVTLRNWRSVLKLHDMLQGKTASE